MTWLRDQWRADLFWLGLSFYTPAPGRPPAPSYPHHQKDVPLMLTLTEDCRDLFAGPGGWDVGLRLLGVHTVQGFEWDKAACDTATAAGFRRVQADLSKLDPRKFDSTGLIASPPCTKFSAAGSGVGTRVMDYLSEGIRAILAGGDALAIIEAVRAAILPTCLEEREAANAMRRKPWPADKVAAKAAEDAFTTALVLEPARWIMGMDSLRWVALEQVPQVLPLWDVYAECLRELGWSVWTGVLNAADYGVPQTRRRHPHRLRRPEGDAAGSDARRAADPDPVR